MIDYDGAYDDGELIWFVNKNDNFLYCMNRKCEIEPIVLLPTEHDGFRENPHCIRACNNIVCLPDKGKRVIVYDLVKKDFHFLDVNIEADRSSILSAYMYKDMLWCVSYSSGEILMCRLSDFAVEARYKVVEGGRTNFNAETKLVGNILYVLDKSRPNYIEFNLDTQKYRTVSVNCNERGFGTIAVLNNSVYLTGFENKIYCVNPQNGDCIPLESKMNWISERNEAVCPRFNQSFIFGKYIILTPLNSPDFLSDELIVLNSDNHEIISYCLNDCKKRQIDKNIVVGFGEDECIFVHDEMHDEMVRIELNSRKTNYIKARKKISDKFGMHLSGNALYSESKYLDIEDFLDAIKE